MPRCKFDKGPRTTLPLCSCGWRGQTTTSTASAHRQAVQHELDAHPGDQHARDAVKKARKRAVSRHAD